MTQWVKSIILDVTPDVRFTPNCDRNSDLPNGRCVLVDGSSTGT